MKMERFHITINRECGEPIIELRDREQEDGRTLIAEFYPAPGWKAYFEARKLVASLNGKKMPSLKEVDNFRLEELERRIDALERKLG